MNKTPLLTVFAIVVSLITMTSQAGQEGFQGSSPKLLIQDVESALHASDDSPVRLTGRIVSSVGDHIYIFRDATGDIKVEIDDDLWRGKAITTRTLLMIRGEVDKEWSKLNIDVKELQVLQ